MLRISGLDEMQRKLERLKRNLRELDGTHQVPADEVFGRDFMVRFTSFSNFDEMLEAKGIHNREEFEAFPDDAWDEHVKASTQFGSWDEMKGAGAKEWATRKIDA